MPSMTMHAIGSIESKTWDFQAWDEIEGARLCRMTATDLFHGDIEGEARGEFAALLREDGSSSFAGLYVVRGGVGRRQGSFVLRATGSSGTDGMSCGEWSVIEGSATDELVGLYGTGEFVYLAGQRSSLTLDYDFTPAGD